MANEVILRMKEDLRNRLDQLILMCASPASHVNEYFAAMRNDIDLSVEQSLDWFKNDSEAKELLNAEREKLVEILNENEQKLIARLDEESSSSAVGEVSYTEFDNRIETLFKVPVDSLNPANISHFEDEYEKLVVQITEEMNNIEKRILQGQTFVHLNPSYSRLTGIHFGCLIHFKNDYLNREEIKCLKRISISENCGTKALESIWEAIEDAFNESSLIRIHRPKAISNSIFMVYALWVRLFLKKESFQGYLPIGNDSESLKDADRLIKNIKKEIYDRFKHLGMKQIEQIKHDDNPFKYFPFNASLDLSSNPLLESLSENISTFFTYISELNLSDCKLGVFSEELFQQAKYLESINIINAFKPSVKFSLSSFEHLKRLKKLYVTVPVYCDFELIGRFKGLQVLHLTTFASVDACSSRQKLTKNDFESISLITELNDLTLSYFAIDEIKAGTFSKFKGLKLLNIIHNEIKNIEDHSTFDCPSLFNQVSFSNNRITQIRANMFLSPSSIAKLDLNSNSIQLLNEKCFWGFTGLKQLNLNGNHLEDLPQGVFDNLKTIQFLDLSKNRFKTVKASWFGNFPLRVLNLQNNPISCIEEKAFANVKQLLILNLSRCKLEKLTSNSFIGLYSLTKLDLSENQIRTIEVGSDLGVPVELDQSDLSKNELDMVSINLFVECWKLLELNLSQNKFERIDLNCFINLRTLRILNLSGNMIRCINQTALPGALASLHELNLADNCIENIHPQAFSSAIKLKTLKLGQNKLEKLEDSFLAPFEQLSHIDLQNNRLSMTINQDFFSSQSELEYLNLLGNKTINLHERAFVDLERTNRIHFDLTVNLENLDYPEELSLQKTNLQTLREFLDDANRNNHFQIVKFLDLSNSIIEHLNDEKLFEHFRYLKELIISNSKLESISANIFKEIQNIEKLDLSGNLIESLPDPDLFSQLPHLNRLNLSDNKLSCVHRSLFRNLNNLISLDLSVNSSLTSLDDNLFRDLRSLTEINLQGNNMSQIKLSKLFKNCPTLATIDLSENKLDNKSLNRKVFESLALRHHLKTLKVAKNNLASIYFIQELTSLEVLDCSNNLIESIYDDQSQNLFGKNMLLKYLDLSGNMLREIRESSFSHYVWRIQYLDLSNNPLDQLEPKALDELKCDCTAKIKAEPIKGVKRKVSA